MKLWREKVILVFSNNCPLQLHSVCAVLPHGPHLTPFFLSFWGISAVPTYAVIPAENICSLLAFYWPSLVIIQEMV